MRKEGLVFLIVIITILLLSTNFYYLFNAFALFILAGGIIGTSFSVPGPYMLASFIVALVAVVAWPFRDALRLKTVKFTAPKKQLRPLQSKKHRA